MKHEIEIANDLCDPEYNEGVQFCVTANAKTPYRNRDNYVIDSDEIDILRAYSIPELYERMGELVVNHMIIGEKDREHLGKHYKVEFSPIFIEVEYYDEAKMKASKAYQEQGLERERQRVLEEKRKAEEAERSRKWHVAEMEKRDREEFIRLKKKFDGQ